jgi:hypothetical protein
MAQSSPIAAFMLGVCNQSSNASLSEHYFELAKTLAWSAEPKYIAPAVTALSVSEHFAKWHYLNFHQFITSGFTDAGRQPSSSSREVIEVTEFDGMLQRCLSEAQKLMGLISGTLTVQRLLRTSLLRYCGTHPTV